MLMKKRNTVILIWTMSVDNIEWKGEGLWYQTKVECFPSLWISLCSYVKLQS